jgi:hypothetical protein
VEVKVVSSSAGFKEYSSQEAAVDYIVDAY